MAVLGAGVPLAAATGLTTGILGGLSLGTIAAIGEPLRLSIGSTPEMPTLEETGAGTRGTAFFDSDALGAFVFGTTAVPAALIREELCNSPHRRLDEIDREIAPLRADLIARIP